jgi:hypothetical protein
VNTLLHELGVADDIEGVMGLGLDGGGDLFVGSDRHGALGRDDPVAVHVATDLRGNRQHRRQVGASVAGFRCPHRDEDDQRVGDGLAEIRREQQPARLEVALEDLGQPRLVDRHFSLLEGFDLGLVHIDADHPITAVSEAGARDQTDVARSHHAQVHATALPIMGAGARPRPRSPGG